MHKPNPSQRVNFPYHKLRSVYAALLKATSVSFGKIAILTSCEIKTLEQIVSKFVTVD